MLTRSQSFAEEVSHKILINVYLIAKSQQNSSKILKNFFFFFPKIRQSHEDWRENRPIGNRMSNEMGRLVPNWQWWQWIRIQAKTQSAQFKPSRSSWKLSILYPKWRGKEPFASHKGRFNESFIFLFFKKKEFL